MSASVFFAGTAQAQLPLEPVAQIGTVDGPNAMVLADLDRDGDLDALASSGPDGTLGEVAWWSFDAVSGWSAKMSIDSAFLFAKDVLAVDLDRDGDLDVAAVSFQSDEVAWWENTSGDGSTWSAKKTITSAGTGAIALAAGDLDGDGDPDLVAGLRGANAVQWFESDGTPGNGGWTVHTVNAAPFPEAGGVALGDLDRDGDLDVVGAGRLANQVAWWENDGTPGDDSGGDGNSWTFHSIASGVNGARDVALDDLDRDGDLDVAAVAVGADAVLWIENSSGDGSTWAAPVIVAALDGARDLTVMDLDYDGDGDLLSAAQDGDRVVWWENASGDAATWTEHEIEAALSGARAVAIGDVDQDGDLDLAAAGHGADSLEWWRNDPIHFGVAFVEDLVASDYALSAVAADIDEDGDLDVVGGGYPRWYERMDGSWQSHAIDALAGVTGGVLTTMAVDDIDGDGDPDVAGANSTHVLWWENDGSPIDDTGGGLGTSWTRHEVSVGHSQMRSLSIVDINRDGSLDLLAADLPADEVIWWENDGSPADGMGGDGNSWTENVFDSTTVGPRAAIASDVDRDGDPDVVVVAQFHSPPGERISMWENVGGALTTRQPIDTGSALAAAVGDIDRDGLQDIVYGESTGSVEGTLRALRQQSPGDGSQWAADSQLGVLGTGEYFPGRTVLADLDLDGDLDGSMVGDPGQTYWYENPGSFSAWARSEVAAGQSDADGLVAQEADGRGAPDLIGASTGNWIVVWENHAGQAKLIASDVSTSALDDGEELALLRVNAISLGRSGDNQAEISRLEVLLEEVPGDPLTGPEASSLLASLKFYEDIDSSGDFDAGLDTLIGTLASPSPVNGVVSFVLPDFLATIPSSGYRSYFLVAETTADASAQPTTSLRVTLLTGRCRMEDAGYDTPLVLQSPEDVSTQMLATAASFIFVDGFESGDTSAW